MEDLSGRQTCGALDYLLSGYDLFFWTERRQPEQRFGSELFKDWASWYQAFINVAVAKDGYGDWGYSAIVGDGLIARFTPLTLSMMDFNGARVDVSFRPFRSSRSEQLLVCGRWSLRHRGVGQRPPQSLGLRIAGLQARGGRALAPALF